MCGNFWIGFIDFILKGKSFIMQIYYEKNDKITLKYFQYCVICGRYRKSEKPKISYLLEKN